MKKVIFVAILGAVFAVLLAPGVKASTVAELQALIAQLQAQIASLNQQVIQLQANTATTTIWCHNFNANLRIGDTGSEVTALQTALQKEGFLNSTSNNYDEKTASAVTAFQEKYQSEVLSPYGLQNGTGYVGPTTRAKLNKVYGCVSSTTPPKSCQNLWWYDSSSTACSQKQFCGAYMYLGLQTFNTQQECSNSLAANRQTCTPEWSCGWGPCTNGYQSQFPVDSNNCGSPASAANIICPALARQCVKQCTANTDCPQLGVACSPTYCPQNECVNGVCAIVNNVQPSITVTSPNGGETWTTGSTVRISWSASGGIKYVRIYIYDPTITGSGSTNYIYDGALDASKGYYDWTIAQNQLPGYNSLPRQYKIRISGLATTTLGAAALASDDSDNYVTIVSGATDSDNSPDYLKNPPYSITPARYPDLFVKGVGTGDYVGGGPCLYGTDPNPTFCKPTSNDYTTYYDHCANSTQLNEAFISDGKLNAIGVSCPNGCQDGACLATASTNPSITSVYPESGAANDTITIYGKNLINTDPTGNTNPSGIYVEFLKNGVQTGTITGPIYTQADGTSLRFQLSGIFVANSQPGTYQIRAVNANGQSNTVNFTILGSTPSITVTSPNGGETWVAGSQQTITWTTSGFPAGQTINVIKLENAVSSYDLLYNTPNDGSETITVPSVAPAPYQVYIEATINGQTVSDSSDNPVTISMSNPIMCSDSDGGDQPNIEGTVTIQYNTSPNSSELWPYMDYCDNSTTLEEYSCVQDLSSYTLSNAASAYILTKHTCPGICSGGACIAAPLAPVISYISPSSAPQDTDIFNMSIMGSNFAGASNYSGCGISPVSDNGFQLVSCNAVSDSEIDAQFSISAAALVGTRNISVQTPSGGVSNSVAFSVTAASGATTTSGLGLDAIKNSLANISEAVLRLSSEINTLLGN